MKLEDVAKDYYENKHCNCAEAILHAVNDVYGYELDEQAFRIIGGFGGGCGCGNLCGAVAASVAAFGLKNIQSDAKSTPDLKRKTTKFIRDFRQKMGNEQCLFLRAKYYTKEDACLPVVEAAARLLAEQLER